MNSSRILYDRMKLTIRLLYVISNFLARKEFYIIAIPEFARNWKIRSWKIIKRDSVDTCTKLLISFQIQFSFLNDKIMKVSLSLNIKRKKNIKSVNLFLLCDSLKMDDHSNYIIQYYYTFRCFILLWNIKPQISDINRIYSVA